MKSRDHIWYFFCRNENVERQSRQTSSGFWKITGVSGKVEDRWGLYGVSGEIGSKRVLVFKQEKKCKGIKSDWVIHEFLYTLLPENQVLFSSSSSISQPLIFGSICGFCWFMTLMEWVCYVFHWSSGIFYRGPMLSADWNIRVTTKTSYWRMQQIPIPLLSPIWLLA